MFKKILIANRGEIAVRIVRTCREMGIETIVLYDKEDLGSLHVRLADQCVQLSSAADFGKIDTIIKIAQDREVDAIHPGYGFLSEKPEFIRACEDAGITFIGPSSAVVDLMQGKLHALEMARASGIKTVENAPIAFGPDDIDNLQDAANELSYPLVIKSCRGGRGRGERLVNSPEQLIERLRRSQAEARAVYSNQQVYLEKAILPAHQIAVQILADKHGNVVHLGEREGSIINSNRKVLEESPAPCLTQEQREEVWKTAVTLAKLFKYENAGSVEFLVNGDGSFYFTEFKARLQIDHPVTETRCGIDLVREQILIAAGVPLKWKQEDINLSGWAMLMRINAEDPSRDFLPSPGVITHMRRPGGPKVRVDSYVYSGCNIPPQYDPLIAKLTVWATSRDICIQRLRRSLEDCAFDGIPTNLPLLQRVVKEPTFIAGDYDTEFLMRPLQKEREPADHLHDLAVAAAVYFMRRHQQFSPSTPSRFQTRWHKDSRRLPE